MVSWRSDTGWGLGEGMSLLSLCDRKDGGALRMCSWRAHVFGLKYAHVRDIRNVRVCKGNCRGRDISVSSFRGWTSDRPDKLTSFTLCDFKIPCILYVLCLFVKHVWRVRIWDITRQPFLPPQLAIMAAVTVQSRLSVSITLFSHEARRRIPTMPVCGVRRWRSLGV
jgi:hypothetical protein